MDPSMLIPSAEPIPVHWGWFKFFLIITLTLHLLMMNVMVGSGIIAIISGRSKKNNVKDVIRKDVSQKLPFIIAFTVNFGVAPLLFLQVLYGHFMYVSSILMGVYWLSIIALLIIAYYSAYYYKYNYEELKEKGMYFIAISVILFLVIGFLFTNNMTLMLSPKTWLEYFNRMSGTILNLSDPQLVPRFLHFMVASCAVGGLFIAMVWDLKKRKGDSNASVNIELGMKWFNYTTLSQIVIGFWFQMSLPKQVMLLFMGGDLSYTANFILSLILTVLVLFFGFKQKVWTTAIVLIPLVTSMVIMRDHVRTAYLSPYFHVSELKLLYQFGPLMMFLITLGIGIIIVGYVLKLAAKCYQHPTTAGQ